MRWQEAPWDHQGSMTQGADTNLRGHGCLAAGMGAQDRTPGTEQLDTDKDSWDQEGDLLQWGAATEHQFTSPQHR